MWQGQGRHRETRPEYKQVVQRDPRVCHPWQRVEAEAGTVSGPSHGRQPWCRGKAGPSHSIFLQVASQWWGGCAEVFWGLGIIWGGGHGWAGTDSTPGSHMEVERGTVGRPVSVLSSRLLRAARGPAKTSLSLRG